MRGVWTGLLHLEACAAAATNRSVEIVLESNHPVVNGRFGWVESFTAPLPLESACRVSDDVLVLARSGEAEVLLAYEDFNTGTRIVTENFLAAHDAGDDASRAERKRLFLNAVWWLLRKPVCGLTDLTVSQAAEVASVAGETTVTFTILVQRSGECAATGVVVTDTLPPNARFIAARSPQGAWSQAEGTVTFQLGAWDEAALELTVTIGVPAGGAGEWINGVRVRGNERDPVLENNVSAIRVVLDGSRP